MASKEDSETAVAERSEALRMRSAISRNVLLALGQPANLRQVQVHCLWADKFRVNVIVGNDAASAKVGHSYFLVADSDGSVLESCPAISKHYAVGVRTEHK